MSQDRFDTIVGSNVHLKGNLENQGSIEIHGSIEGQVTSEADIVIGESANIQGPIKGKNIDVSGKVVGQIECEKLELQPGSEIDGDINVNILSIKSGAIFHGNCQMKKPQDELSSNTKPKLEVEE